MLSARQVYETVRNSTPVVDTVNNGFCCVDLYKTFTTTFDQLLCTVVHTDFFTLLSFVKLGVSTLMSPQK